jgi:putative phosphoribosyl transferase
MAMFQDRAEAGFLLAEQLTQKNIPLAKSVVVGITRGGVIVGSIVSSILGVPFIPLPAKKITIEDTDELAVGAIGPGDIVYWDPKVVADFELEKSDLARMLSRSESAYKKQVGLLRKYIKLPTITGRTVILVDDGVATGATVKVAALSLAKLGVRRIILAVPLISEDVYNELLPAFKDIVTLTIAEELQSVGEFYESFDQITDDEVIRILQEK